MFVFVLVYVSGHKPIPMYIQVLMKIKEEGLSKIYINEMFMVNNNDNNKKISPIGLYKTPNLKLDWQRSRFSVRKKIIKCFCY